MAYCCREAPCDGKRGRFADIIPSGGIKKCQFARQIGPLQYTVHMDATIRIETLTKRFTRLTAVDQVSLEVGRGEIFGLIGPNGAGKTTLIKMMTTLVPATSGDAWIAGFSVRSHPAEVRRRIGYVPQMLSADGALTAYENLLLSARLYAIPRAERNSRIREALSTVGLTDKADVLVQRYSGGMIRRLEIAQGLMHRPAVLFLDEPTVGLDPTARRMVWNKVLELRETTRATMFVTTHYMAEAEELCDRIAIIHRGRIQHVGTPQELKSALGPEATLDDVFVNLTDSEIGSVGDYREVQRTRRNIRQRT
jgi:ABC-2 type transport system ATP-binding protein